VIYSHSITSRLAAQKIFIVIALDVFNCFYQNFNFTFKRFHSHSIGGNVVHITIIYSALPYVGLTVTTGLCDFKADCIVYDLHTIIDNMTGW